MNVKTINGAIRYLKKELTIALNSDDKATYSKLHDLIEDCIFDSNINLGNVKYRYEKIASERKLDKIEIPDNNGSTVYFVA